MNRPVTRTYLAALVDGGGTVPPELGVVRRLVGRGHHVTVLGEESMIDDVRTTGAAFRPWVEAPNRPTRLPADDPWKDWECRSPMQMFDRLMERQFVGPAAGYAADVAAAVADRRPDLVLCNFFAYGAMAAAEAAGVPFDVLMPNAYLLPAPGMPPVGIGVPPASGPLGRLRDRALTGLTLRQWDKGLDRLNGFRRDLGLQPVAHFFDQAHRARRHLVLTSEAFDFPARLPAHVRYVGAVLDDPAWAEAEAWEPPAGNGPLVLVSLSSTFQDQAACLQRVVDALAGLPVRGYVTTGPALDPAALSAVPNVTVVAAAPHSEVLRHADAVVTHGGHGTVIRALAAGVPMVVLPHGRDQADNARRVTMRGAGLAIRRGARPRSIRRAVRRIIEEPSFRTAAERLGEAVRRDAEGGALLAAIEDVRSGPARRAGAVLESRG